MKENMKIRGQLRTYLQWPIILSVFLLAANLAVGIVSPAAGLVMSGFTVIYVLVALWLFIYRRKRLMGGLVEFSAEYAWVQKQLLYEMAVPYAIADTEGHFLWLNHSFSEIVGQASPRGNFWMRWTKKRAFILHLTADFTGSISSRWR